MADSPWIIRRAAPDDGAFMADMLVEAVNWSSEWKKKSRNRVLSAPGTARYIAGWPRETDLGVIAEAGGSGSARPGFASSRHRIRDTDLLPPAYRN